MKKGRGIWGDGVEGGGQVRGEGAVQSWNLLGYIMELLTIGGAD